MRMHTEDKKTDEIKTTENQQPKSKVTPFRFPYNASDDPKIDAFILRGLQEEADETEMRINADPELSQINPPDDQYDKIVARLKEMGIWEEDEEEETRTEEEHEKAVEEARREIAAANQEKTPDAQEEAQNVRKEESDAQEEERNARKEKPDAQEEEQNVQEKAPEVREELAGMDALYQLLSEKDREAIALGRRAQERRKKRSRRIQMVVKRGGIVAAAFVLLIGVSMNVSASRQWIVQMWGAVTEVFATRTVTNNIEETRAIQSTVAESLAAMEEIEEITGIPGLDFNYWPEGMEYLGYEIMDESLEACVFYSYEEKIVNLYIRKTEFDETHYYTADGDAELIENLKIMSGIEAEIWNIKLDEESEIYRAEFVYEEYRYILDGYFSLDEFTKIVKNMNFLSKSR